MALEERPGVEGFSPCPGCDQIGFTVQVWVGDEQMMQCGDEDCRVEEYRMIPAEDGGNHDNE